MISNVNVRNSYEKSSKSLDWAKFQRTNNRDKYYYELTKRQLEFIVEHTNECDTHRVNKVKAARALIEAGCYQPEPEEGPDVLYINFKAWW